MNSRKAGKLAALVISGAAAALYAAGAMVPVKSSSEILARAAGKHTVSKPAVVIDPGHGGADGGCVSVNGVAEKGINLAVGLSERDILTVLGYEVTMTRDRDVSIFDEGTQGLAKQKQSDMKNRLALINECKGVAISIHQNQFTDSRYSGGQMFYSRRNKGGQRLAGVMQERFHSLLQPENEREIKAVDDELYLLDQSDTAAVMIECGFLSNAEEAKKLESEGYQKQVALTIASGVVEYGVEA